MESRKCYDKHVEAEKSFEERAVTLGTRWSTLFRAFRHLRGLYFNYETGNWVNHSRFTASGEWNFSCRRFQACVHIRPTAARLKFNEISAENTSPLVSNNSSMFPGNSEIESTSLFRQQPPFFHNHRNEIHKSSFSFLCLMEYTDYFEPRHF